MNTIKTDVAIIGAGPSGAIAGSLLKQAGHDIVVLEQSHFPRFSIGESLLPQCMEVIEQAGMREAIEAEGFQYKNGAMFAFRGDKSGFDFTEKFSPGAGTTFQVQRARFDQILAQTAQKQGVDIRFGHKITTLDFEQADAAYLDVSADTGEVYRVQAEFVLDASGFGRVLPRALDLEEPSDFPSRRSVFTHVVDNITDTSYDRDKVLIIIHPKQRDVWFWLIPFSNGTASIGAVGDAEFISKVGESPEDILKTLVAQTPDIGVLLKNAEYQQEVRSIQGYACGVKSLFGERFALLGNAGEFLDPVFSSGVTIAMMSAKFAAPLVSKTIKGQAVDWQRDYADPLMHGVDVFRTYVNSWYDTRFQDVIFSDHQQGRVRAMICSILAGYAWDRNNPFVKNSDRKFNALYEHCADA